MKSISHIQVKDIPALFPLSSTMVTVLIEDDTQTPDMARKAMQKLRGSGNGNLLNTLHQNRQADRNRG
jgi:hypothetical protein